jgi:hypothetical protein
MQKIYVLVIIPELRPELQRSIYSYPLVGNQTAEKAVAQMQRTAKKRGLTATYELTTREEYDKHYAALREKIVI